MSSINYLGGYFESLAQRLSQWNVMLGFILAVIGLLTAVLARAVVRRIRKNKEVDNTDKIVIILKFTGFGLVLTGLIFTLIS